MPSNIEIKARVPNPKRFREVANELSSTRTTLKQEETFFACPKGRLKLRTFPEGIGELIYYERPDETGPKCSQYWISKTREPDTLLLTLRNALGDIGVVRKTRELFLVGQTRIHLDDVEGLGVFAELEVVMKDGQIFDDGKAIAEDLMQKLGIKETDLVDGAYIDLITEEKAINRMHPMNR
ncbi:class IV adenylate cyclase [uncultured Desulfobacter sp.]|uniref:class IV adenylate cyclase n=1 Tax=uncultured Desulfobacter sp. TaxID=240139 RepID=UPI0029F53A68|nr:class IV adenylate cyclase [uncultured Desulfobacter sp.]